MSTEETKTIDERYKYFRMMKRRYERSNRQEKGQILDEMQAFTGKHRKELIGSMNGSPERQPRAKQPGSSYGPAVDDALRVIAETLDFIRAEAKEASVFHSAFKGEEEKTIRASEALKSVPSQLTGSSQACGLD